MKKFLEYLRKTLVCIIGLFIAVFINLPLIACYIWILSVMALLFLGFSKINDFACKKSLAITRDEEGLLGIAILCTFGGLVVGYNYVVNNWDK